MKKNKFTEFFKGKGYYVLLFVGVMAIAAVAIIGSQLSSDKKDQGQNQVDLNDADDNIAAGEDNNQTAENNPVSEGIVNNGDNSSEDTAANDNAGQDVASNDDQAELEGYGEDTQDSAAADQQTETAAAEEEDAAVETTGSKVQNDKSAVEALSFKADDGLRWPVDGDVIMNYSMDHTIYHATLMKYTCNPAIIIEAEVGTEVKAAAKGVVSSIIFNEETGNTITMDIGNGYSLIYGQLKEDSIKLKVGDLVEEKDVIGTVDEPTKYYTVEGSNLYFEVMQNEETVNPMLLLE